MANIFIKAISQTNIESELESINFDSSYLKVAKNKYEYKLYKIFNLRTPEASILKQLALSVGTDCAVNRDVIVNNTALSDCILGGSIAQINLLIKKLKLQPFKLKPVAAMLEEQLNSKLTPLKIRNKVFDWSNEKYLMGILNITPDSFSDGGKYFALESAIKRAGEMIAEGVDIIDIGAESTRPFSESISLEEEQKRLLPILKELRKTYQDISISIDTRNSETAMKSVELGADIINDVSGGTHDKNMFKKVAELNVPYILTHSISTPADMPINPSYENVVEEVYTSLLKNVECLIEAGMKRENIIADIGIGFGKTAEHNFELLKRIDEFTSLNLPLLVGHSRKSFLSKTFNLQDEELDDGTAAVSAYLLSKPVSIIRVHNLKKNKLTLDIVKKIIK